MAALDTPNGIRMTRDSSAPSEGFPGIIPVGVVYGGWLAASMLLMSRPASAQEALKNSLAGQAAAEARTLQQQAQPYTFKTGDFKLLVTPSLGLDWNDNVRLSKDNAEDDFILKPAVALNASYPLTAYNLLSLSVTFGYDKYFNHNDLSRWQVESGSEVSFDVYVKDLWINFHDRVSYSQDAATEAAVANTGSYGTFQNTAGLSGTWDLQDITLSLGYDHQNYLSTSSQFDYTDHSSEMIVTRAGLKVHPKLTLGVEGTFSPTTYDQKVLNDNKAYSGGVYGDWRPGVYFSVQPRFGYTIYDFEQTSAFIKAQNQNAWYADLTVAHHPTEVVNYSLSAGHELRLGIESDLIEDWYIRPNINWSVLKDVTLQTSLFYEHGKEGGGRLGSSLEDNYDWYGGGLTLSYEPVKSFRLSLNYRLTLRSSTAASREYTQNLIGLMATYSPK